MRYRNGLTQLLILMSALSSACGSNDDTSPGAGATGGVGSLPGTGATAGSGASPSTGGLSGTAPTGGAGVTGGTGASPGTGGVSGGSGGSGGSGAVLGTGGTAGASVATGGLPALHVEGTAIKDPSGKTIVLRGVSLMDLGALYAWGGSPSNSATNITQRIDKILATGLAPHVLRLPVYPRTVVNMDWPNYSPAPFPVGPAAPASAKLTFTQADMTADAYYTSILKPAVDYATAKGMYVIIDYHQIDDTTTQSLGDALTFWKFIAPKLKDATNVIYEAFNEPINIAAPTLGWAAYAPAAQQLVDTIRAGAPNNLIILGSPSWCQQPAGASGAVTGTNVVLSAHIYPGNWNATFKAQVDTAAAAYPLFISEWGYGVDDPKDTVGYTSSPTWGTELQTYIDGKGASWTAWVTDDSWTPKMFSSVASGTLTPFGTLTKDWLVAKTNSDWVH